MSGTEDSNQRWLRSDYTTDCLVFGQFEIILTITDIQIWLHKHKMKVRFVYRQRKRWDLNNFTTTGGASETFTNLILKENEIKKKIIFLIILLFNINYLNKNYLTI